MTAAYFWYSRNKLAGTEQVKENTISETIEEIDEKIEKAKKNALSEVVETNKQGNKLVINESGYQILYLKEFDQFLISILQSPFETIRQEAEKEFLRITQAEKDTACQLDVVITTPRFANPDLAGQTFYLSFCEKIRQ